VIGASLSLTGDFSADGQAFPARLPALGARRQTRPAGLLGHQVQIIVLNEAEQPTQVVSNYNKLSPAIM